MANRDNLDKKDGIKNKEESNLVVRPNTDITFNDSFFSKDNNIETDKTDEVYETYDANEPYKEEKRFSYDEYEREKRLAFREDNDVYNEKEGNFKLLATLLSVGAIGILGYLGFNYFQNDNKSNANNINISQNIENNTSKQIMEETKKRDIEEEKRVDGKKETLKTEKNIQKSISDIKDTSVDTKQKEMIDKVIKSLKEKKKKNLNHAPVKVIEHVEKKLKKSSVKSKIKKDVKKKKSKIVTVKRKEEKPKRAKYKMISVKKGDTLASISEKFYGNPMYFKKIIRANRSLKRGSTHLHIGQKLIIPILSSSKKRRVVTIRKGDTLASIAKRFYGDSRKYKKIIDANYKIKNVHTPLHLGQKIYVPR